MHAPDYFHNVIAPALLGHQKSFHALGIHYHFTSMGGSVVLGILFVFAAVGLLAWLARS